jgi:hypothetical protein
MEQPAGRLATTRTLPPSTMSCRFCTGLAPRPTGTTSTVDVKGLAGTTSWYAMNCDQKEGHYIVLVSFLGRIHDPNTLPEVYVVPSTDLGKFLYRNPRKTHEVVQVARMRQEGTQFRGNWKPLLR